MWGIVCASGSPLDVKALPTVSVSLNGHPIEALIDTGCTQTIVSHRLIRDPLPFAGSIIAVNGDRMECKQVGIQISLEGHVVNVNALVLEKLLPQFELILGMDVIRQVNGITFRDGEVHIGAVAVQEDVNQNSDRVWMKSVSPARFSRKTELELDDVDFHAFFDGVQ